MHSSKRPPICFLREQLKSVKNQCYQEVDKFVSRGRLVFFGCCKFQLFGKLKVWDNFKFHKKSFKMDSDILEGLSKLYYTFEKCESPSGNKFFYFLTALI